LSVALTGAAWYGAVVSVTKQARIMLFSACCTAVLFLSDAVLVFLLLCVMHEVFKRRDYFAAVAIAALGLVLSLPWSADGLSPFIADGEVDYGVLVLYCCVPGAVVTAMVFQRKKRFVPLWISSILSPTKVYTGHLVLLLVAMGIIITATGDPSARNHAQLNYYLYTKQWRKLLLEAEKRPVDKFGQAYTHIVNRALFHEGRLLDDMLAFPQDVRGLLMNNPGENDNRSLFRRWVWSGWTLFELGLMNNAENITYEAVTRVSHYPEGLRLLAFIHIVKGMPGAARTFLNALRKDFVYRPGADSCLHCMQKDSALSSNAEIVCARARMPLKDAVGGIMLRELCERDPGNRMAFEYMVAEYLLTRNLDSLSSSIHYFKSFNYTVVPRLCEEALVVKAFAEGNTDIQSQVSVRAGTLERFARFSEILERHNGSIQEARDELASLFGDSYFFYYLYGYTGHMR
jgi:hypothetical protein